MSMVKIDCYNEIEQFLDSVKAFDVSSNPFLSYSFLSVYLKYFPKGDFCFLNVLEDEELIGIIPLEYTLNSKILRVKKLRFIGYRQFNYEQYICRDEDMLKIHEIFMDYIEKQHFSFVLNIYDINSASPLYRILNDDKSQKAIMGLYSCPCLQFTDDFDTFFKTVYQSSKKRSELKKFQKKVSELGDFKIVNVEDKASYDHSINYINQIYKVHKERFADVYATSFFGSEKMRPYYSELIKSLMYGEKAHLSLLILDEIVIAFIFCLTNGEVLIDWIPAFDPAFAKYSLGIVQYKMLFEEICNQGKYKIFDYSKGSSVYKRKWAKEETVNYQFILNIGKGNPVSWLLYFIDKNKFQFKVYLREKGVLEFIKNSMGRIIHFLNKKEKTEDISIKVVDAECASNYVFNYSDLANYPVNTREVVLTSLYQGKKVVSVSEKEVVLA